MDQLENVNQCELSLVVEDEILPEISTENDPFNLDDVVDENMFHDSSALNALLGTSLTEL